MQNAAQIDEASLWLCEKLSPAENSLQTFLLCFCFRFVARDHPSSAAQQAQPRRHVQVKELRVRAGDRALPAHEQQRENCFL